MNPDAAGPTQTGADRALAAEVLAGDGRSLDFGRITALLADTSSGLAGLRRLLACAEAAQRAGYSAGLTAEHLLHDRARLIDLVVIEAWRRTAADDHPDIALAAVGGYGRAELHPYSDVDLLVLLPDEDKARTRDGVSRFLALLWDAGIEVRHSTRSVRECHDDARADLTVVTTLMESRWLFGPEPLVAQMQAAINAPDVWPSRNFFEAKLREQQTRHHRYDDTAYNLEPDVKGSPGGLRDIQTIGWIARRHLGLTRLEELAEHGLLTRSELRQLLQGREFLWGIRLALHLLTGRREDRLLFDHQGRLAQLFGYRDASYMLAVEQLMQRYYRTVMDLGQINEMLLQRFQEAILMNPDAEPVPIDERFQVRNGFLQLAGDSVFEEHPSALLELFVILQQHPDLKGLSASTIALIRRDLYLIDDAFRQDPRNHSLFLTLLRAPEGVTHELRRMNRYGVLGRYIAAFGRIVGRMQYDLFHAYTVDEHTLFVVSNLRRFALDRFNHEFPRCSEIMQSLPAPEVAYLAGLFHDIAKGRGGDHSEMGAMDAEAFCLEHGMSRYEARLVAWLVRHHLLLSLTAQKRDISDPAVITEFANKVGDEQHLDYLYVLTIADVRGTNPKLWNSWKAQLFDELYGLAKLALRRGLENPIDKDELVDERKTAARALLDGSGLDAEQADALWTSLGDEYFLRCRPEEVVWHTTLLCDPRRDPRGVLVGVQEEARTGGSGVMLYARRERDTFAAATAVLDELGLTIADARIIPLANGYSLSTYIVLEQTGEQVSDAARREQIRRRLLQRLGEAGPTAFRATRRPPRQVRMFSTPTLVSFARDAINQRTVMELTAGDRPGLLCRVGHVLQRHQVRVQTAKIMTVGERAEDVFYVTDDRGQPLDDALCAQLTTDLRTALEAAT